MSSTAKQRLWLTCLGYIVDDETTGQQCQQLFEDASATRRYQLLASIEQRAMASEFGIQVDQVATCHEVAGSLYEFLLMRAWVYSVWRQLTGEKFGRHRDSSLPARAANSIAIAAHQAGHFFQVQNYSTTEGRDVDVFYRMSKSAKNIQAFQFVAETLANAVHARQISVPVASPPKTKIRTQRQKSKPQGCLLIVLGLLLAGSLLLLVILFTANSVEGAATHAAADRI